MTGNQRSTWRTGAEHGTAASCTDAPHGTLQQAQKSSAITNLPLACSDSKACNVHSADHLLSNRYHGACCDSRNDGTKGVAMQIALLATLEAHLQEGCRRHTNGGRSLQCTLLSVISSKADQNRSISGARSEGSAEIGCNGSLLRARSWDAGHPGCGPRGPLVPGQCNWYGIIKS